MSHSAGLAVVFVALLTGCPSATNAPAPSASSPAIDTAAPTASSASASASDTPASGCAFWGGRGFTLKASTVAGRADFTRELAYDDASGALTVHDSDPFATGKEEKKPRVIDRTLALPAADREALGRELIVLCPTPAELGRACAPGGCSRLEVTTRAKGTAKLEDSPIVAKVMARLAAQFPELRKQ